MDPPPGTQPTFAPQSGRHHTGARVRLQTKGFPLDAVGESHYQDALERICGGHNRDGHYFEVEAVMRREPANPHDPNAVSVWIEREIVGYLARDQAARVSGQMAEDGIDEAACEAQVVDGWRTNQYDEGHFGVRLAVPRWGWIDFGRSARFGKTRR